MSKVYFTPNLNGCGLHYEDNKVVCPYDRTHVIFSSRFAIHLMKCEKNHRDLGLVACPFNATHRLTKAALPGHMEDCPDKQQLVNYKYQVGRSLNESNILPVSTRTIPTVENWDNCSTPSYKPQSRIHRPELQISAKKNSTSRERSQRREEMNKRRDSPSASSPNKETNLGGRAVSSDGGDLWKPPVRVRGRGMFTPSPVGLEPRHAPGEVFPSAGRSSWTPRTDYWPGGPRDPSVGRTPPEEARATRGMAGQVLANREERPDEDFYERNRFIPGIGRGQRVFPRW